MLTSLVYALVRTYNEREERLEGVTLGMLKPLLFRNVRRVFLIMIVGVLLVLFVGLIVGFIATVIPFMAIAFLFVLLVVVVSVPLAIWASVYLFEDIYTEKLGNDAANLLQYIDVLVDGLFDEALKSENCLWRGSTNQQLIDIPASLGNHGNAIALNF